MSGSVVAVVAGVMGGAAFGAFYLGLLWVAVHRLPQERGGVAAFLLLGLARAGLLLGALAAALMLGASALSLIAALGGFLAVRLAATRPRGRGVAGGAAWK
jgi:hypothetical protein